MTPESRQALDEILSKHKSGEWDAQTAGDNIVALFERQPVNYKRNYSDDPAKALNRLGSPQIGETIRLRKDPNTGWPLKEGETMSLRGYGDADGEY